MKTKKQERTSTTESPNSKQAAYSTRVAGTKKPKIAEIIEVTEVPNHRKELPKLLLGTIIILVICYGLWLLLDHLLKQI